MLKKRLVGVLVIKGGIVVQSIGFKKYLPVGTPAIAVEYLNSWGIDEITLLDIDATKDGRSPDIDNIRRCSGYCHVPLAVGGGIRNLEDMKKVIHAGADKIVINTAAITMPELIKTGAEYFGNQCIVVSIDAKRVNNDRYEVFSSSGNVSTKKTPVEMAKKAESFGAGEILLNSIDKDGSKTGFDLDLIEQVVESVNIPVIVCGGAGHPQHFKDVMNLDVSAVAAANYFHFSEHSVITTKRYLNSDGIDVRLDSYADYAGFNFDFMGRAAKTSDPALEKMRFEYIPEEVI